MNCLPEFSENNVGGGNNKTYNIMQMNGRKVLGPPEDWVGEPPSTACELFIRNIPKDLDEQKLFYPFLRFGPIFEFRLPLDFNQENRGYAYVKYTNEDDAACAMEVLQYYYFGPNKKLEILHSYEKCRLFVNNIPRELNESEIEKKFREIFPTMQRIFSRGKDVDCNSYAGQAQFSGNRGYVFVHFATHADALEAKKNTTPGVIRMWGRDLKVVWANSDKEHPNNNSNTTLFVRNVDLSVNKSDIIQLLTEHVHRTSIRKVSKVRTTAFFDFTTREAAETILKQLQGVIVRSHRLDIEWAKPSNQKSLHKMLNTDYDAVLRLICIANGWQIPVVLFGTYYENEKLQYGAVMLRNSTGQTRAVYALLNTRQLVDVHARLCEIAVTLIDRLGCFPDYDYLFSSEENIAHLLGIIVIHQNIQLVAASECPIDLTFDCNEIFDLAWAVYYLSVRSEETLLQAYQESFCANTICTYLSNWIVGNRIFGTIMPKYRDKPKLKHNLNDTQIALALCYASTGTNCSLSIRPHMSFYISQFLTGRSEFLYIQLPLTPIAVSQTKRETNHVMSHIQFGGEQYYHPNQRKRTPPIWIPLCTYRESIRQMQRNHDVEIDKTT